MVQEYNLHGICVRRCLLLVCRLANSYAIAHNQATLTLTLHLPFNRASFLSFSISADDEGTIDVVVARIKAQDEDAVATALNTRTNLDLKGNSTGVEGAHETANELTNNNTITIINTKVTKIGNEGTQPSLSSA